jgi:hypothetical protein
MGNTLLISNFPEVTHAKGFKLVCDLSGSAEVDVRPAAFVHDLALVTLRDYHHSRERRHHDDPLNLGLGARPEDVHGARHGRSQQLDLQQNTETYGDCRSLMEIARIEKAAL